MDLSALQERAAKYQDEMVAIRRHLHQHPELSYQEVETTKFIVEKLDALGIPVDRPLDTGCVGVLEGGIKSDRVVALRADIDALPIHEEGEHKEEFMSQNEGVAHCCGHDSHTANLLGTAHILSDLKEQIEGTVLLIFQPGEEKLPGGGRLLCKTGYLQEKGIDVIYGLHSNPNLAPGEIALRKGPLMARPDEFKVEVIGQGGHAASPHEAIDPIVMASQIITQLQTIVSRSVNPTEPAVVTVGKISGGSAHNVIPEKVELLGTVRTFNQETAYLIRDRIESIVKSITEASGGDYTFTFDEGYPAVINTEWAADNVIDTASKLLGADQVKLMDEPLMAGEDFAFYQQHFPGTFFFLGSGGESSGAVYPWHHPQYNIDEDCFQTGAALMASLVFQDLPEVKH
ncbi:M20 metallopeptidase family protein [Fodinibius salsisoli]|uniref:Amidohydrolase n=1 Tax=Fodinibius salsisoli TaxID=2820877 RepID=A0ABT3PP36_9BACT|nr:amidohydrolase [Fodinibius salsisoli]MCW9707602.1 amidohydrolase [Fodinibius salsisoli]